MRDVACAGYVAGGNTSFFGRGAQQAEADLGGKMVGTYQPENVRNAIQERLAFTNQVGAKYASMLAFPMFENQMDSAAGGLDTVMSVTSRLLPWDVTGTGSQGMHNSFPGGENVFQAYKAALALDTIHVRQPFAPSAPLPPSTGSARALTARAGLGVWMCAVRRGPARRREPGLHFPGLDEQRRLLHARGPTVEPPPIAERLPEACAQEPDRACVRRGPHRKFDGFASAPRPTTRTLACPGRPSRSRTRHPFCVCRLVFLAYAGPGTAITACSNAGRHNPTPARARSRKKRHTPRFP